MNKITYFNNTDLLAKAAAEYFIKIAKEAIELKGKFTVALSGGSTPGTMYQLLTDNFYNQQIEWKKCYFFWGDERCVPLNDKDNNAFTAKNILLDKVFVPKKNIFIVPVDESPVNAAIYYEATIKIFFKTDSPSFDLILLGMGNNGHTASLFPNTTILHEQKALVKEVYVNEIKMNRISFTAPLINNAKHILFLVAGAEKDTMLKKVLEGDYKPDEYPAQLIKNAEWFISK
jgi:6-phosphogluconolactonase